MYVYGIHIACHCASEFLAVISSAICGLQGQVRPMHLQNCRQILVLNCCDRIQPALPGAALSKFPIQTADMKSSLCETSNEESLWHALGMHPSHRFTQYILHLASALGCARFTVPSLPPAWLSGCSQHPQLRLQAVLLFCLPAQRQMSGRPSCATIGVHVWPGQPSVMFVPDVQRVQPLNPTYTC